MFNYFFFFRKLFQLSGSSRSGAALRKRWARNHDYLSSSGWAVMPPQATVPWFWWWHQQIQWQIQIRQGDESAHPGRSVKNGRDWAGGRNRDEATDKLSPSSILQVQQGGQNCGQQNMCTYSITWEGEGVQTLKCSPQVHRQVPREVQQPYGLLVPSGTWQFSLQCTEKRSRSSVFEPLWKVSQCCYLSGLEKEQYVGCNTREKGKLSTSEKIFWLCPVPTNKSLISLLLLSLQLFESTLNRSWQFQELYSHWK